MDIDQLREVVSPLSQNTDCGFCNQITVFIYYYKRSILITLLKIIDAFLHVSDIFYLTFNLKLNNFSFQILIIFVPEKPTSFPPYIVWIVYIAIVWML
jgi:hypothetical protein